MHISVTPQNANIGYFGGIRNTNTACRKTGSTIIMFPRKIELILLKIVLLALRKAKP